VYLSKPHKKHCPIALHEAEREVLYSNASSPNPDPGYNSFLGSPLTKICIIPFSL